MRIGYALSGHRPARDAVAVGRAAEESGFDEVWLSEDYFQRGAFAVGGAIAAGTERVQIGIGVVNPYTRHPVLTAMEFAALDEIAEGRAVLGLGASNSRWMQDQLGISFGAPLSRLAESADLVRQVLSGNPVSHHGAHWDVEAQLSFVPQRARPPIVFGVKGPRALAAAGRLADGVLLSVLSAPDYVGWARAQVAAPACTIAGYLLFCCDDDGGRARDAVRATVATYLGIHGAAAITREAGIDGELASRFRAAMLAGRPAVELVTDALLDVLVVAGDREHCAARLRAYAEAGLETAVLIEHPGTSVDEVVRQSRACLQLADLT